jgi:hypothetical protein
LLLAGQLAFFGSSASASVNNGPLEMDGDATNDSAAVPIDWEDVYATQVPGDTCPSGASACAWENDGALNATIFTGGGSKDPQDVSSWKWKDGSGGLPDKDNLLHSFAARFTDGADELLYFGSDRFSNEGDAHQAFWFFQNKITRNANGTFDGVHKNGDLLVISEFSNGGTVSTIVVYKWNDQADGNLELLVEGTGAKCNPSGSAQPFCGIVNAADGTAAEWDYLDKFGFTTYRQGEFFEGGINLNDPNINLGGRCFASFASETRSSTSTTAVLKDFVLGSFGDCGSRTVTTPKLADGTTSIPSTGVSIGTGGSVLVRDSAQITVTGGNVSPTGSVAFALCGPTATSSTALCETGGTTVGTTNIPADNASNPVTVVSPTAEVTSAGRYCFRAEYSGDAAKGITGSSDFSATECFIVNPVTPTLTTQAGADVLLGNPVTDTATLSGTANKPGTPVINPTTAGGSAGGTITFGLYGPGAANCNTLVGSTSVVTVTGDGSYDATPVTPTAAGTYYWKATYSGDSPNTLGVTHNADCTVSDEEVVVSQLVPTISTAQEFVPNDSATITVAAGGGAPTGDVAFELHNTSDCSGQALYTETVALPAGESLSKTVETSNTTAYTATETFYWKVTFTSTNAGHTGAGHACGVETSSLTIDNDTTSP